MHRARKEDVWEVIVIVQPRFPISLVLYAAAFLGRRRDAGVFA